MPSSILNMSINKTQNIPIIIGSNSSFDISIQNTSSTQKLYNLGLSLTLPDGMVLSSSTIAQTSNVINSNNSTTYSWINIKDLAPMEIDFKFSITVKCNTKFKNGTTIPFGYNFSGISVGCQVDTTPRGIYDIGNKVITQQISMSYVTVRFTSTIITSKKVLKGAGTLPYLSDYTQVTTATCQFFNNDVSSSLVNISILLEDGIRYIGNIVVSGTDASQFSNPTISTVSVNGIIYTQLYYGNVNLSINSNTKLTFSYSIWNKYNNNQGNFIVHGTSLNMSINMESCDTPVTYTSSSNTSFLAMDLIITTSISESIIDVETNFTYSYIYKVGQYYNIENIIVDYFIPDGMYYLSSLPSPTSVVDNFTLQGFYLTYNFALATQNSTNIVTIYATVDNSYRYKFDSQSLNLPVVASDPFLATTDISGTLIGPLTQVTDNSNVSSSINVGTITKQFIKGYYKDGTPKTINTLAPGDLAQYNLIYNASTLKAIQKQIYIYDFFPLSADPIDNLNYIYTGISPVTTPQLISPHGVDFYYGDVDGLSSATINFQVPIASLGSSSQNINLMKLNGINTYGHAYSNRSQVSVNIGSPNLNLTKSVSGPNKSAIQSNEVYTYTVTINNSSNLGTETDAFDFTLNDTLSDTWFTLNQNSISVTGTGSYNTPTVQSNNIVVYINKLSPGQFITLTYTVTISPILAPGVNITTTATNTNPYSQLYNSQTSNFQYSNLNKNASVTLASLNIAISKTNFPDTFKVGSYITYTLIITVPKGTIAYGVYVNDILPSGYQTYLGPAYRNGVLITPIVFSNTITFPSEGTIDSRVSSKTISYILTAVINNATTSTQTNTLQCFYQQAQNGSFFTISNNLAVTINYPNLLMTLSAIDKTTSILYTQNANISTNSIIQFKLNFKNNSIINLVNGTIEIPINNDFLFFSIDTTILCSATYDTSSKKIIITIPTLGPSSLGYLAFSVIPQVTLPSGTSINTQATAISYYNDMSTTKVYGGEYSNILNCVLSPNVSLLPDPLYQINNSTSFIVTPPGNTAVILDYFKNTGGGYDSFTLEIQPVDIDYSLYIDNVKITDVVANTLYKSDLTQMSNLSPNTTKVIQILVDIPIDQPLGIGYDFTVTAISKTSPYPQQTVLNIDPHPF